MTKTTKIIISIVAVLVFIAGLTAAIYFPLTAGKVEGQEGYYLFCYFLGNDPTEEHFCFALSNDGYSFNPVGDGKALVTQKLGTGCNRDPYIFRANGKTYIIATDMKSDLGWNSNYAMVMWESEDLVNWTNERIIDIKAKEGYGDTTRTWAPQVIYDEKVGKYMVYWSHCQEKDWKTYLVYAYLNDDFTDIGEIKTLYQPSSGKDAIDGDIIYENGIYYLYYKDEKESKICYVYSDSLTGPYIEPEKNVVSKSWKDVEGSCMYKIAGTDTYLMIMDEYSNHHYYMQTTTADDMVNFKPVRSRYNGISYFKPRHGSMMAITKEEYEHIKEKL